MNINDIRVDKEKTNFKFRVAGIVESHGKILVTKMREDEFFYFPGGHVELLEDTKSAAERELKEELYFDFKVGELLYIHENFFRSRGKESHELCFYFKVEVLDKNLQEADLVWQEIDNGEKLFHDYRWLELRDIERFDIRPKEVVKNYVKDKNKFMHFSTREID